MNPSASESGYGTIAEVTSHEIYVNAHNGHKYKFNVGACSRLEGTEPLPKIGQAFFYTGVPHGDDSYDLYKGTAAW